MIRCDQGMLAVCFVVGLGLGLAGCGGDDSGGATKSFDACAVVTQDDAKTLFGGAAEKDTGAAVVDPAMLGECLWTQDTATANQLLQFRVWKGTAYYSKPSDAAPLAVGDEGYVRVGSAVGVEIAWTQGDRTIDLDYSTAGPDAIDPATKVEDVKNLAVATSGKLK